MRCVINTNNFNDNNIANQRKTYDATPVYSPSYLSDNKAFTRAPDDGSTEAELCRS